MPCDAIRPLPSSSTMPDRKSVIGVPVSVTDYAETVEVLLDAAVMRRPLCVTALAVHGVVEAVRDPEMRDAIAAFDIVTPDGQPVRMALNLLHRAQLQDRVYGPTLMLNLCEAAAARGVPIYLYGSTEETVTALGARLSERFAGLQVAATEPSLFRPIEPEESAALAARIEASGAGLVFIGLGCPRQEKFAHAHCDLIGVPQICVGAAFDFHAGTKKQAPAWMQRNSLEWLFRLVQEPRRLAGRYLYTNTEFVARLARQYILGKE